MESWDAPEMIDGKRRVSHAAALIILLPGLAMAALAGALYLLG